jgi:hypothetical protein
MSTNVNYSTSSGKSKPHLLFISSPPPFLPQSYSLLLCTSLLLPFLFPSFMSPFPSSTYVSFFSVIYRYHTLKSGTAEQKAKIYPRVIFFGGKAAPGYYMAKTIIKLINNVADVINNDRTIGNMLKVVFIPNYCVSLAEIIIPASDISQHISTAGTEASGTSNMKFAMNGGLIIGTLDGANVEIREEIGEENMFIFGARTEEVPGLRKNIRAKDYKPDKRFLLVLDQIKRGYFGDGTIFEPLLNSLSGGNDFYLLAPDFPSYLDVQETIDATYKDQVKWTRMSMLSTFSSAKFSSDRTIREYAKDIWGITVSIYSPSSLPSIPPLPSFIPTHSPLPPILYLHFPLSSSSAHASTRSFASFDGQSCSLWHLRIQLLHLST